MGHGHRRPLSIKKQSFWALSDQAASSIGNFFTAVYLARVLSTADYGIFALLYGSVVLSNSLLSGAVVYPMQVLASREGDRAGAIFRAGMQLTLAISFPCSLAVAALTLVVHRPTLFVAIFFATLAWQLQETARRALLSELRFKTALLGDSASYVGQAILIFLVSKKGGVSLAMVFWLVCLTSLLALGLQLLQLRQSFLRRSRIVRYAEFWSLGSWAVLTNLVGMLPTVQGLLWIVNIGLGAVGAGILQTAANTTGVLHPLLFTLGNILVPAIANAEAVGGRKGARDTARYYATVFGAMVIPYVALLFLLPGLIFKVMYGNRVEVGGFEFVVRFFALAYLAIFGAQVLGGWLRARTQPRQDFMANLFAAIVMLFVGLPLAFFMGVKGAAITFFMSSVARLAYQTICVKMRSEKVASASLAAGQV